MILLYSVKEILKINIILKEIVKLHEQYIDVKFMQLSYNKNAFLLKIV